MDKTRICMSRTINLAKKKCPSKVNLLAYETAETDKAGCVITHGRPALCKPPIKRIKICTGAQLKKICRPPPCPLPPKKSLMYYSWQTGLWGDSEETEMFYVNFCHLFGDSNKKNYQLLDACETEMEFRASPPEGEDKCNRPPIDRAQIMYRMKEMWNHTVSGMFVCIAGFPGNLSKMFPPKAECPKK